MQTNSEGLTTKQREVLEFIGAWIQRESVVPTVREIAEGLNLSSPATAHNHIAALKTKGFLEGADGRSRALRLTDRGRAALSGTVAAHARTATIGTGTATAGDFDPSATPGEIVTLPVIGRVAAGSPILAEENIDDTIALPASLVDGNAFMLRVKGDSMVNAGIFNGDLVIVRSQDTATDTDIVVALIDGEATVKTYYREANRIRLQPENDTMAPIYATEVTIAGKVVGLLRPRL